MRQRWLLTVTRDADFWALSDIEGAGMIYSRDIACDTIRGLIVTNNVLNQRLRIWESQSRLSGWTVHLANKLKCDKNPNALPSHWVRNWNHSTSNRVRSKCSSLCHHRWLSTWRNLKWSQSILSSFSVHFTFICCLKMSAKITSKWGQVKATVTGTKNVKLSHVSIHQNILMGRHYCWNIELFSSGQSMILYIE